MAQTIKLRRSATPSAVPTTTQIELGEMAINTYDGKLFIKKDNGIESIVEIGASGAATTKSLDGGFAASVYTSVQSVDGGGANG